MVIKMYSAEYTNVVYLFGQCLIKAVHDGEQHIVVHRDGEIQMQELGTQQLR